MENLIDFASNSHQRQIARDLMTIAYYALSVLSMIVLFFLHRFLWWKHRHEREEIAVIVVLADGLRVQVFRPRHALSVADLMAIARMAAKVDSAAPFLSLEQVAAELLAVEQGRSNTLTILLQQVVPNPNGRPGGVLAEK
jgi:hypothetical protein